MRAKFNWPSIYAYLICLAMLIAFIVAGSQMIRSGLNMLLPEPYPAPQVEQLKMKFGQEAEITVTPDAMEYYEEKQAEFYNKTNLKGIITGLLMLCIIIPIYIYHWRLGARYRSFEGAVITVRDFYFYMASLITLLVGVITLLNLIDTLVPLLLNSYSYLPGLESIYFNSVSEGPLTITKEMVEEALTKAQTVDSYFPRESLIRQLTTLLVTLPLYALHWRTTKNLHSA